jgi:hypothetical protein
MDKALIIDIATLNHMDPVLGQGKPFSGVSVLLAVVVNLDQDCVWSKETHIIPTVY